jgi:hypothetical protein
MEVYHFAVFQTALEGIRKLGGHGGPNFPDIRENPNRGDIMPEACTFLDKSLPLCSVIRPRNTNLAGAVAAATGLVDSGLFLGQSQAFFDAVVPLAKAADAALRKLKRPSPWLAACTSPRPGPPHSNRPHTEDLQEEN